MIRNFFRDGLAWVAVSGAILGGALWFSVPAHADTTDQIICTTLDEYPTVGGVLGVALGLMDDGGYSAYAAGQKIAAAAITTCPEHLPEVLAFADTFADGNGAAV